MVNSVTSSGEEGGGRLCGMIAPSTSGLYDFFFFARKYIYGLGNIEKKECVCNVKYQEYC